MEDVNATDPIKWSDKNVLDLIRKRRNDLIKDFLDERNLIAYFAQQYNRIELSSVKIQMLKKDLMEMLIEPVDCKHYESLIEQIRHTDTASVTDKHEELFYKDVEKILKRYVI